MSFQLSKQEISNRRNKERREELNKYVSKRDRYVRVELWNKAKYVKKVQNTAPDDFKAQYLSPEWGTCSLSIKTRDRFKCTNCGCKTHLNVHHKKYDTSLKVWEYPPKYLVTLCQTCHKREHDNYPIGSFYVKSGTIQRYSYDSQRSNRKV